jgi:hypothetical protein
MTEQHRRPLMKEYDNEDKSLYIRYPNCSWKLFDDTNECIQHQKKGLELFIESEKDTLDVSIPHYDGGHFVVEFGKNITKNEETGENMIIYYYIKTNLETVQMMYAKPEYIAYITRLTT